MTLLKRIQELDDFKALRLYEHMSDMLFDAMTSDAEELMSHLPDSVASTLDIQKIRQADASFFTKPLDGEQAVAFARTTLELLATNPSTSALLKNELDNWRDEAMVAETILAIGSSISLIMLFATSEITYDKVKGLRVDIGGKDEKKIAALGELLQKLLKPIMPNIKSFLGKRD